MDKKIKLLVVTSIVAVMATGCSRFNRTGGGAVDGSDGYTETGSSSSQMSGGSQVGGGSRGGLFSQQRSSTCAPCATNNNTQKAQTTVQAPRVYKPAAPQPATKPYVQPQGQHSQQWYVDRWKRQQQQQQNGQQQNTANYNAGTDAASNATYYDYSSAGRANNTGAAVANTNVSTSNKSIYTGSYQQKTYKPYNPTTYSGGSAATTNTNTTYVSNSANTASSGGSTYTVKKGDTVFEIMRQTGVYWKDIIKLNNLQAPAYNINPGQTIRLK